MKIMTNPWLTISYSDYENHMLEVGQTQILSKLTDYYLKEYKPTSFVLIGCATGNGLEHVDSEITKNVFAVDINADFLEQTKIRFENKIQNLTICCIDLQNDKLCFSNIDLVFCGLILEYVEPEKVLRNICEIMNEHGKIVIIIQENKQTSFVTKTKYKSLRSLTNFANEISEKRISSICENINLKIVHKLEIQLNDKKSFIVLAFEKNE
jgi:SAM-dependent methyltransferase